MISAAFPYQKKRRRILGREMAHVEVGEGDPIVLLHGNPTSSYLWRNVIPHLQPLGRCIAPDLMGMGDSDKLPDRGPGSYRFVEHRRYLDGLLEALDVRERVTLVIHDWGSTLGFDWANRHRHAVRGIAYMEAMVGRQYWDHWDKFGMRPVLQALRSEVCEQMVLQENFFVEKILPGAILRKLSDDEMAAYRRPFAEPGKSRRPTLTWPREIPIEGDPADVDCERGVGPWRVGGWIELGACDNWARGSWREGVRSAPAYDVAGRRRGRAQPQHRTHAGAGRLGGTRLCGRRHRGGATRTREGAGLCERARA
jgi:haloalkane dehalogenase